MMKTVIPAERVIIRDFADYDFSFFCALETDEFALRYEADTAPSEDALAKKFQDMLAWTDEADRPKYAFLVERKEDKAPLGKVLIWQIDRTIAEWEMGWVMLKEHAGQGYASEAARALVEYGFTELGANRICANCNDANLASERVMQKIGMKKEGLLRQTRKLRGQWYGSCIYSILKSEYGAQEE